MQSFFLLAACIAAIIALIRIRSLSTLSDRRDRDYQATVSDLRREIASLRSLLVPAPVAPPPKPPEPVVSRQAVPSPVVSPAPLAAPQVTLAAQPKPAEDTTRIAPAPPRKSFVQTLREMLPLEDVLGMNLFAKIGIVLLVLGFALLGRVALVAMGPGGKVALLYSVAVAFFAGGLWLERKDRYRLIGRGGIGGGWALFFFTTYAMHHVDAMQVMSSNLLNSVLLLAVSAAMVWHTLRYRSQLVTGLAFLLAFSTVALSQDTVYALSAGVILALGMATVALRMGWYEMEVFGIVAGYGNHFYWLYKLYPHGFAGHAFPEFLPSSIILVLYWLIYRVSYVVRRIDRPRDERLSTVAALLNTGFFGATMKFQSTHPELAFYALLILGVVEFCFGQLPAIRRRRPAFILLTVLGSLLVLAAVPFRFTGNNIALLWMIAAEGLLIAGIAQKEVVFRRLGLLTGTCTGLLIVYEARNILELRPQSGILLLACSVLFYLNAHYVCDRWQHFFTGIEEHLVTAQSYLGAITAWLGVWAVFHGDWTALGWAGLMLSAALGTRLLHNRHVLMQAWALAGAVAIRAAAVNCHLWQQYPHHVTARLITLPILAAIFYLTAWALAEAKVLRSVTLWTGTFLLAGLIWLDVGPAWIAPAWLALGLALSLVARRLHRIDLGYQEHVLAFFAVLQLLAVNLDLGSGAGSYLPVGYLTMMGCAAVLYALSRYCTPADAPYRRYAAWAHSWGATLLLAALAWHRSSQPWLACIWVGFALVLAVVDRIFTVEELPWQAHTLAALALCRAVTLNVYTTDKWRNLDVRLLTLSIVMLSLYALARWVRIPQPFRDRGGQHAYSWAGSILAAWMLSSELRPVAVAVALAAFGLILFECGLMQKQRQLRFQAYVALTTAFVRIFFVNLMATSLPGERLSPRIYTVVPIALIYFFVWARLRSDRHNLNREGRWAANLFAWFGTGSIAALLYVQTGRDWTIVAWAVLTLALMAASLVLESGVFLQQAALLVAGILVYGVAHNIFGGGDFTTAGWHDGFAIPWLAACLLLAGLPVAFRLRSRDRVARYPEQWLFFAPVFLITLTIAVKMNPGMVTLSWGLEGMLVILLGLTVNRRSYRITGLVLLLLCVGKIVLRDAWRLQERDRYITFIVLGAALTLVSMLYNKYRESMRKLL